MIEYEIVKHDRIRGVRVLVNTIRIRSTHMHHDTELLYVIRGSGTVVIRNHPYHLKQDDSLVINAYEPHEILSEGTDFTLIIIQFSGHFLQDYCSLNHMLFPGGNLREQLSEEMMDRLKKEIFDLSVSYLEGGEYFSMFCVSRLSGILYMLMKHTDIIVLSESEYTKKRKTEKRMIRISEYIEMNYMEPIRLADLAEKEGITETHLSHFIRQEFGISFQDYLRSKRLESAVRLIGTNRTLCEISDACGFSELKYMTKAFRQAFHMTPAEYRELESPAANKTAASDSSEYIYSNAEALALLHEIAQAD
ncbi:MAG: AraC family transcriptional regulator [Solobacterium sp.]|nr:AraC family transcriptional regulator [Solobacterium sp.]